MDLEIHTPPYRPRTVEYGTVNIKDVLRPLLPRFQPENDALPYFVLCQYGTVRRPVLDLRCTLPRTVE